LSETTTIPTLGRIVHYVSKIDNGPGNEVISPAVVICTVHDIKKEVLDRWGPEPTTVGPSPVDGMEHETTARPVVDLLLDDETTVHLLVHGLGKDYREYGVKYDEPSEAEGYTLGTWHWPPRV
jgi:hypothetical protein